MSDNNEKELNYISPFKYQLIQAFPFIADDFDQLTAYGLFCRLAEKVNELVTNNNNLNDDMVLYIQKFNALKTYVETYLENLDVQDEIDNKLDEMVENGTLTEIISSYITPITDTQNQKILNLENQIKGVASGSPLVATSVSGMTDTNRIYVNTTNGHWYYYDGSAWTDGGTYQSTGIDSNSITSDKIFNVGYEKVFDNLKSYDLNNSTLYGTGTRTVNQDGSVTIKRTDLSANVGILIPMTSIDTTKDLFFKIKISGAKAVLIFTYGAANLNWGYNNGTYYGKLSKQYLTSSVTLSLRIYANEYVDASGDVFTIDSFEYTQDDPDLLSKFDTNLTNNINNLSKKYGFNEIEDFRENILDKESISHSIINKFGFPSRVVIDKTNHSITIGKKTNSAGVEFGEKFYADNYLHIKGKITTLNSNNSIKIFLNNHKNNNQTEFISVAVINQIGEFDVKVDLSYYAVYSNMNYCTVIITDNTTNQNHDFVIENLDIYKTEIEDLEIYDKKLSGVIRNIQSKFDGIETQNGLILKSPNGTSYKIKVDNSGNLSAESLFYNKGLFIGNSLLLGFGTHGMASTSTTTDYYYYTTQGCITKNPNFTSTKIRGSLFEQSLSESDLNNFYSTVLDPALTSDIDVVFIQLGDNNNTNERKAFLQTSAGNLINHIKTILPNASIYWVGVWYNTDNIPTIASACADNGATFINISGLNTTSNQSYVGATYYDANGNIATISDPGIASHPSDTGMQAIANQILNSIY